MSIFIGIVFIIIGIVFIKSASGDILNWHVYAGWAAVIIGGIRVLAGLLNKGKQK